MSLLKIYKFPDLVLAKKAAPVPRVEKSMHKLADDMLETMYHAPGIGLAANQVGILDRVLVLDTEYEPLELEDGETPPAGAEVVGSELIVNRKPIIVVNPQIIQKEGEISFTEGCLSVPEYTADVKRALKIKIQYQDIDGVTKTLSAEGLLAVAIQHEIDHLDGKLFIDRLSPLKKEMIRKKLRQERAEREREEAELGEAALVNKKKHKKGL